MIIKEITNLELVFLNNKISPLIWPDSSLPYDLEAISIIPSFKNQYILMESTGKCYKIKIEQRNNQITDEYISVRNE